MSLSPAPKRDRTAFVFRRIALPDRLVNDAWWLCTRSSDASAARTPATVVARKIPHDRISKGDQTS